VQRDRRKKKKSVLKEEEEVSSKKNRFISYSQEYIRKRHDHLKKERENPLNCVR